jgi:hypothetical protein
MLHYTGGVNRMTVTLDSAYTVSDTVMTLSAGHGARLGTLTPGNVFYIKPTEEEIADGETYQVWKVTSVIDDTLTVSAAQDGTTDTPVAAGTELESNLGPAAFDQHIADQVQTGADASFITRKEGFLYLPSDGVYIRRDSGSAGVPWGPAFPMIEPVDGDWSWVNQGTATSNTTGGGIFMRGAAAAGIDWKLKVKSVTAPYVAVFCYLPTAVAANNHNFGVGWRQSSDGKLIMAPHSFVSAWLQRVLNYSSPTVYAGTTYFTAPPPQGLWSRSFVKLEDNNTNRIVSISADGQEWIQIFSHGRTTYLTPDQVCWGISVENATYEVGMRLIHYSES